MSDEQDNPGIPPGLAGRLASGWGPAERDGHAAHRCGFFIEDHRFSEGQYYCPKPKRDPERASAQREGNETGGLVAQSVRITSLSTGEVYEGLGSWNFEPDASEEDLETPISLGPMTASFSVVPTYDYIKFVAGWEQALWTQQNQQIAALRGMR